ncbi:hypothetical protein [Actibacterium sp. 188UL27-1]|uniref:hypothetical protein n=1 Tax=Actibacterium sp. 188UL27-1 TaxID=2786961 RepID=UPI001959F6E8|nr:hypothetical protein [Actibacterium sp. 188UL27-1]MBM7068693.1 hypothetical protein [Actibacterium sp. 188UL27-1]
MPLSEAFLDLFRRLYGEVKHRALPERDLPSADRSTRHQAIVDEIDTTTLPRTLTFKIGDEAALALDVGNQCLHRVLNVDHLVLSDQTSAIVGPSLDGADRDLTSAVGALLAQFCDKDGPLSVLSTSALADHDPSCAGIVPGHLVMDAPPKALPASPPVKDPAARAAAPKTKAKPKPKPKSAPKAAKPKTARGSKKTEPPAAIVTLFDALSEFCVTVQLIDAKLAVNATGGTDPKAEGLWQIDGLSFDIQTWIAATRPALGDGQMLIARSNDLQGTGLCVAVECDWLIVASFPNKHLARLFSVGRARS